MTEIKLSEIIKRNYPVVISEDELDMLLENLSRITVALGATFDMTNSLKEKTEINIQVRRIESFMEKLQKALSDKDKEIAK